MARPVSLLARAPLYHQPGNRVFLLAERGSPAPEHGDVFVEKVGHFQISVRVLWAVRAMRLPFFVSVLGGSGGRQVKAEECKSENRLWCSCQEDVFEIRPGMLTLGVAVSACGRLSLVERGSRGQ